MVQEDEAEQEEDSGDYGEEMGEGDELNENVDADLSDDG
jgi:hypothetical protein